MGLYELIFISNLDKGKSMSGERTPYRSNLFGMFTLKQQPATGPDGWAAAARVGLSPEPKFT
ncbi:hypothetical protein RND71_042634 [Anisodus tanguticus]|uniref:Uncharacterized protein n=1 Tax=Anisodus tanguticus TaxID=243964 RepID=A0AAE1QU21_9SOLA|nr:hypothetical protein RND71_042634 [Anisodus tanguticus]